ETSTYKLELPAVLKQRRIHPTFHASLIQLYHALNDMLFPNRVHPEPYDFGPPDDHKWFMEEICGHRWTKSSKLTGNTNSVRDDDTGPATNQGFATSENVIHDTTTEPLSRSRLTPRGISPAPHNGPLNAIRDNACPTMVQLQGQPPVPTPNTPHPNPNRGREGNRSKTATSAIKIASLNVRTRH
ncbi:hypothetical protein BD779DRAFT_1458593, partial [Infundibulicybe gibba]